jgi:hypothetical protein
MTPKVKSQIILFDKYVDYSERINLILRIRVP